MGLKGTKLYSILTQTCPKCHEEKLFEHSNPYNFKTIFDMPKACPNCGQKFTLEPGFYYGAMYVSYGVSIAFLVAVWVAMLVLYPSFSATSFLLVGIPSLVVLTPVIFRLSRTIWINFFVKYDPPK